jgi:hypothetical protein
MHEVADLPHQSLMLRGRALGRLPVVIKAGRGHGGLEVADALLALGDTGFEVRDAALPFVLRAAFLSGVCLGAFLIFS